MRLGQPKQLLQFEGESLLRRAARTALDSVCRPIVVVLGADAEKMRPELAGLDARVVENADWARGMGTSLRAGLAALEPENLDAVVVLLCDQPLLTADVLDALVAAHEATGWPIAASEYGGRRGVPALFARALFPELRALGEAEGARSLLQRHAPEAAPIPFPEGIQDIDTERDWAQFREAQIRRKGV